MSKEQSWRTFKKLIRFCFSCYFHVLFPYPFSFICLRGMKRHPTSCSLLSCKTVKSQNQFDKFWPQSNISASLYPAVRCLIFGSPLLLVCLDQRFTQVQIANAWESLQNLFSGLNYDLIMWESRRRANKKQDGYILC